METNTSLQLVTRGSTTFMAVVKTISKSLITISLRKTSRMCNKRLELYIKTSSRFWISMMMLMGLIWREKWEPMTHLKLRSYSMTAIWEKEMKLAFQLSLPFALSWNRPLDLLFSRCLSELKSSESEATSSPLHMCLPSICIACGFNRNLSANLEQKLTNVLRWLI